MHHTNSPPDDHLMRISRHSGIFLKKKQFKIASNQVLSLMWKHWLTWWSSHYEWREMDRNRPDLKPDRPVNSFFRASVSPTKEEADCNDAANQILTIEMSEFVIHWLSVVFSFNISLSADEDDVDAHHIPQVCQYVSPSSSFPYEFSFCYDVSGSHRLQVRSPFEWLDWQPAHIRLWGVIWSSSSLLNDDDDRGEEKERKKKRKVIMKGLEFSNMLLIIIMSHWNDRRWSAIKR